MATSITTKPSPYHSSPVRMRERGSSLRRTIEIAATLLQKLTLACDGLMECERPGSEKSIRRTEDMKRAYLQMMAMENVDLEAVVDAFFLNAPPGTIVRQVSAEEPLEQEEQDESAEQDSIEQQPRHLLHVFDDQETSKVAVPKYQPVTYIVEEEEDENGEDLRRQVGSNDYECNDVREGPEEREGIEPEVREFYHQPLKQ